MLTALMFSYHPVLVFPTMKPTCFHRLFLFLFVTTFGTVAFAAPVSTKTYRQGLVAHAEGQTEIAPCVTQYVTINATDATNKDHGTTRSSFVDVVVNQFDCNFNTLLFAAGTFDLATGQFSVSNTLINARLKANLTLTDFVSNQPVQFNVDLRWRPSDTTQTTTTTNLSSNPFLLTLSSGREKFRFNADVTGTVASSSGPVTVTALFGQMRSVENGSRQFVLGAGRKGPSQMRRTSTTIPGSALSVTAHYTAFSPDDPCAVDFVSVLAMQPTSGTPTVDLNLIRFDQCIFEFVFSVFGVVDLPPGALTVASDLQSASLIANVTFPFPEAIPVSFDLSWAGTGVFSDRHDPNRAGIANLHRENVFSG